MADEQPHVDEDGMLRRRDTESESEWATRLLDGLPDAFERIEEGREQIERAETISLEEWKAQHRSSG
jgi:hypothetical protein